MSQDRCCGEGCGRPRGRIFVVSGPAGAGKGSVLAGVREVRRDLGLCISATTRAPRSGETDGVSYFFLDEREFRARVEAGEFVEWAEVHGNLYGTLKSEVDRCLQSSSLVLEIDVQGAFMVREQYPDAVLVFIAPPSMEVLRERLVHRGSETPETLERRMADAVGEMEMAARYNETVVNDDLSVAVGEVLAIMARYESDAARM